MCAFTSVHQEEKLYAGVADTYGHKWQVGDIVGVCLDLVDRTVSEFLLVTSSILHLLVTQLSLVVASFGIF